MQDYRISSEKLVLCIRLCTQLLRLPCVFPSWIAYQISMINWGLEQAGITGISPVSAYIRSAV